MIDNYYKEHERHIRHIMCIFLALETLLLCLFIITDYFVNWDYDAGFWANSNTLTKLHYHLITPDRILSEEFRIFCIGGIICTLLSMRFKWFYRIFDGLHCLLGIIIFCGLIYESTFAGLILCLILSARFCIYLFLIN